MAKKKSYITVTDQFCGAGGSSQGVRRLSQRYGGGLEVKLALNHWKLAIETHNTNFPDTFHDCTDISACDPRRYLSTDILITSPECTTHSPAGGNNHKALKKQMDMFSADKIDPATERSRATMWDVCRFAEYHSYNCIIVENVVEAKTRWPLFDVWLTAMHTLGYNHKCVYLNSRHCHPTPQSRDRMYIVFWKKGNKAPKLNYMPVAFCSKCSRDVNAVQTWKNVSKQFGKYRQQYVYCCSTCTSIVEPYYYAAFNCIDWSDIGIRIGDRSKPLSPNTIKRIDYGLKKYGKQSFVVNTLNKTHNESHINARSKSVVEQMFTQTTAGGQALVNPFIVNDQHTTGIDFRVKGVDENLPSIATVNNLKLITPFIIKGEHSTQQGYVKGVHETIQTQTVRQTMALITPLVVMAKGQSKSKPASEAMSTQTSMINHGTLTPPFLIEMHRNGYARPVHDEINTVTAGGVKTGIVTNEVWNSFIAQYYGGSNCINHISEEIGTVTTTDRSGLVTYQELSIEDCYYRMLKPREIKLAMAFDHDYIVLGSGKDQVKQLGNAVTPPAMEWLVQQCVESLS